MNQMSDVLLFEEAPAVWEQLAVHVERFVEAWEKGGDPPSLAAHLATVPEAQRRLTAVELIKIDLEYRWLRRRTPRYVEDYLAELPLLADDPPVDLLYEEFHVRRQFGETAGPLDLLRRFPRQAEELRRLLGAGDVMKSTTMVHREPKRLVCMRPGDTVDDFELLTALGEGAFGYVFLARQRSMQRLVALKVTADRGTEPQTLAQLDHENIVRVYDQRRLTDRGVRLMYMQFAAGGTLQSVIERLRDTPPERRTGRDYLQAIDAVLLARGEDPPAESSLRRHLAGMSWPELVAWIGLRLASALDYAHQMGILHRDVKPANVLLTAEGSPKLADFNISFSSKIDGATPTAYFGGSLAYMSPEQLEACSPAHDRTPDDLDGRSDFFSLGVMLWELLTGARPFDEECVERSWALTLEQMIARRRRGVSAAGAAALVRDAAPGLDRVLEQCLAASRDRRFATGGELARHLELCRQPATQRLLYPPPALWRSLAQRYVTLVVVGLTVLPNAVAGGLNYAYNRAEIVSKLQNAEPVFQTVQMTINLTLFPIGVVFGLLRIRRAGRYIRDAAAREASDDATCAEMRRRTLLMGHEASLIGLALWGSAGVLYPAAMHFGLGTAAVGTYVHFFMSLALCGMIAAAYPFLLLSFLSLHAYVPLFVRLSSMGKSDRRHIERLRRLGWAYLGLAALVPMTAVAMLSFVRPQATWAPAISAVGGIIGFGVAFLIVRRMQGDLDTLSVAASGEVRRSPTFA